MTPKNNKQSSFVRLFHQRFAPAVERGEKLTTVRPTPKRMPKVGDKISLRTWTAKPYRSKMCVLMESEIVEVKPICIDSNYSVYIDNFPLNSFEVESLALADGFGSPTEFYNWFDDAHGLPFEGILIRWKNAHTEPIAEVENVRTYWRYRCGGYDSATRTYGRCGTKSEAEAIMAAVNSRAKNLSSPS